MEFIKRRRAAACFSLSYSKELISIRYHRSIVSKNNYSLKYITTGQFSSSSLISEADIFLLRAFNLGSCTFAHTVSYVSFAIP